MIPQSIFKFHPTYDAVLIQLLTKDPLVRCLVISMLLLTHLQGKLVLVKDESGVLAETVTERIRQSGATDEV